MTTVLRVPDVPVPPGAPGAHVRRTAEIPIFQDAAAPLRIRFLDPIRALSVGDEFRFEVAQPEAGGRARVAIEGLDFTFAPIAWGEVRVGPSPFVGIVRVAAVHRAVDIYDRPKYEMVATFKARGGAEVETVTQFALAVTPAVVELKFFARGGSRLEAFSPQEQARPLDPKRDIRVSPPDAAEVLADGRRLFLRVLKPGARPRVTVTFPNDEVATLEVDLDRANGAPPTDALATRALAPALSEESGRRRAQAAAAKIGRASWRVARVGGSRAAILLKKAGASAVRGGRALLAKGREARARRRAAAAGAAVESPPET